MEIDVRILRGALRGYGDLRGLARSPLVGILGLNGSVPGNGGRSAGLALREALRTGIEALRPDSGEPRPEERRWRPYLILSERYLRGRSAEWTRDLLHLARTTFFEEQDRAVGLLAAALERGGEADPLGPTSASPRVPFLAPSRSPRAAVGRALVLEALRRRLIEGEERGIALVGLPGVGKTTLALELAHDREVRSRFPDGVLWASLGPDPDPLLWLDRWGEAAGLPPEVLRAGGTLAERGARVREALEGRRMLLVLDDVWRAEVALALRVGGPLCAHLLTARRPDVALDCGEAVERIRELDLTEGLALLRELAPQAVEADRASCERIVRALGGLPLGLVLAGRFLAHRSHGSQARRIREALAALEDPGLRLSLLPSDPLPGEAEVGSLRAVIGLSDAALPREARELLSALALFPPKPNSFSEEAALAVSGGDPSALDALVDQGLLEGLPPDRYTLHRSLHDYARGRPPGPEIPRRLVAHHADLVRLRGDEWDILERERDNLLAAYRTALEEGMLPEILLLATGLYWLHERSGAYSVCEAVLTRAREFLERRGEGPREGESGRKGGVARNETEEGEVRARLLCLWGDLWVRRGCSDRGIPILREAFRASLGAGMEEDGTFSLTTYLMAAYLSGRGQTVWETCEQLALWFGTLSPGSPQREAVATVLGFLFGEVGDPDRAETYLQEALREMRCPDKANRRLEGWVRNIRGTVLLHRGEWGPAGAELDESLRIYRQVGDRRGEGWDFCQLARLDRQLGRFGEADRKTREAENLFRDIGELMGRGYALHIRARLRLDAGGEEQEAEAEARESLTIHRELNCGIGIACAQLVLALPLLRRGRGEGEARERIREALELRRRGRFRRGESRALAWLAWADLLAGRTGEALEEAREAEAVARAVGSPNTRAGALTVLGRVLLEREDLSAAEEAFREAQEIRELLAQPHFLAEPLAGRIAVARMRGDESVAAALAARVPRGEDSGLLPGAEDPDWVRETLGLGS